MTDNTLPLIWMDFETPGVLYAQHPLETAAIITDANLNYSPQQEFHALCRLPQDFDKTRIPEVVRQMHTDNGLWNDLNNAPSAPPFGDNYYYQRGSLYDRASSVDYALALWITEFFGYELGYYLDYVKEPLVRLAGSGVSHFDSRILLGHFPLTWTLIAGFDAETKPTLDIGVVRRFLQTFDLDNIWTETIKGMGALPEALTAHRALDDVELFIEQARSLRGHLAEISEKAQYWDAYLRSQP